MVLHVNFSIRKALRNMALRTLTQILSHKVRRIKVNGQTDGQAGRNMNFLLRRRNSAPVVTRTGKDSLISVQIYKKQVKGGEQ
jgi:hypothetical protein